FVGVPPKEHLSQGWPSSHESRGSARTDSGLHGLRHSTGRSSCILSRPKRRQSRMGASTPVIQTRDLYKYYGRTRALGPVSFSIEEGEIIGLLGLNGAGKTTALRILACDLMPSGGEVRVEGIDVVDDPRGVRTRVGYLPDRPPLYGDMTVHEYLVFAACLRGLPRARAEQRARTTEEATQLTMVAGDVISSLSHGYRPRVGIAQAIVHVPRPGILDEPIAGLDPIQIVEMRQLLLSLKGSHTILLSSHILSEISQTCDRLFVIRAGCIVDAGTEAELSS